MGKHDRGDMMPSPHLIQRGALLGLKNIDTSDSERAYVQLTQITDVLLELLDPKIAKEVKRIRKEMINES